MYSASDVSCLMCIRPTRVETHDPPQASGLVLDRLEKSLPKLEPEGLRRIVERRLARLVDADQGFRHEGEPASNTCERLDERPREERARRRPRTASRGNG
jgi:hypothetical protein